MRMLQITCQVPEDKAGSIIADLAARTSNFGVSVVEDVPFHKNRSRLAKLGTGKRGGSRRVGGSVEELIKKALGGSPKNSSELWKILVQSKKMTNNSLRNGLNRLKVQKVIKQAGGRGSPYSLA